MIFSSNPQPHDTPGFRLVIQRLLEVLGDLDDSEVNTEDVAQALGLTFLDYVRAAGGNVGYAKKLISGWDTFLDEEQK